MPENKKLKDCRVCGGRGWVSLGTDERFECKSCNGNGTVFVTDSEGNSDE